MGHRLEGERQEDTDEGGTFKGKIGERKGRIRKPKVRIPSLLGTAKYRIPDEVTKATLKEVKNVMGLSRTAQILDYLEYAKIKKLKFILQVRK